MLSQLSYESDELNILFSGHGITLPLTIEQLVSKPPLELPGQFTAITSDAAKAGKLT